MEYLYHYLCFITVPAILFYISYFLDMNSLFIMGLFFLFLILYYRLLSNKINQITLKMTFIITIFSYLIVPLCLFISQSIFLHPIWNLFALINLPYFIIYYISLLFHTHKLAITLILIINTIELLFCCYVLKPQIQFKKIIIICSCIFISLGLDIYVYRSSPSQKYKGHDFQYMNGFSSTDLSPFFPYTKNNQLVSLQQKSSFIIENEKDMPILDGAEACYPVYAAIANATYKNIAEIEKEYTKTHNENGKIVTFYNTSIGYTRLFQGEIDMFFGAKPSQEQLEEAKIYGVELEYTPIGKEAFVFFVNENNPIHNLKSDEIRSIYHGNITNWKSLGGQDCDIVAFQRPEKSGSQAMMHYFMKDVSLKEPITYEMQSAMTGIIHEVAEYYNEYGAIGYTFKYFLEGLHQEENIKILSIDNIYPTVENIKNKTYPISTYLYCVTLKSNQKENVKKLKEFLLSPQGQYIIEKTGYCSLY